MSQLGELLKRIRDELGISQGELAKAAAVDQGNLSRIESGKHANPSEETLRSLATALASFPNAAPGADLLARLVSARDGVGDSTVLSLDGGSLELGFPHCLWSAPLISLKIAIEEDDLAGRPSLVRLHSRSTPENGRPALLRPLENEHSADSNSDLRDERVSRHPNLRNNGATAKELVALVRHEQLHGAVVAREVLRTNLPELVPVAEILHSVGGSMLLLVARRDLIGEGGDDLAMTWESVCTSTSGELPALFAPDTNAGYHLAWLEAWLSARRSVMPKKWPRLRQVSVALGEWDKVASSAQEHLDQRGVFAFVGWDPYVSWLADKFQSDDLVVASGNLHELGASPLPLPYLSLVLCLREDVALECARNPEFDEFLRRLATHCARITAGDYAPPDSTVVTEVADYLGFDTSRCNDELRALQFGLRFEPTWIDVVRRAGSSSAAPQRMSR